MNPDRNHWPTLAGAAVLVMALLAPGAFGQNNTTDPSPDGNETMENTGAQGGAADRLSFEAGHAEGRHVSFDLDAATGSVCDWTFEGTLVLTEISWGEFTGEVKHKGSTVTVHDTGAYDDDDTDMDDRDEAGDDNPSDDEDSPYQTANGTGNETDGNGTDGNTTDDGSTDVPPDNTTLGACMGDVASDDDASSRGGNSRMMLHDNPIGSIKLEARGPEEITIVVADGFDVSMSGNRVTVTGDGLEARLWKDQDSKENGFEVDGQTITFDSGDKGNIMWRVVSSETEGDAEVADAVENGDVACEVLILDDEDVVFESGDDDEITVTTVRSPTTIDINIEVDVDVDVDVGEVVPDEGTGGTSGEPTDGTDGNTTGNGTDGNATDGDGPDGNATGNGTTGDDDGIVVNETVHVPVTVIVIDIDATVVVDATVGGLTVLLDGQQVQTVGTVTEVVDAEEATAMVVATADGGLRVVTSAGEGSQVLSLQAEGQAFDARSVPLFGDDSDDAETTASGEDDGIEGSQDEDGGTDISVPSPAFATLVAALVAAAAFALRRKA